MHDSCKFRPLASFGKLVAAIFFVSSILPAEENHRGTLSGRATIQLKNASYRSDLAGMDLVLAPTNLIPEIRRLRMETWRTDGIAVTRNPDGEENPVGVRIDFADGYKNLDLKALSQAAVAASVARTQTSTNGEFTFSHLSPGRYALYGQYKSRYAVAYWLLEVEATPERAQRINLSETNAAEVFNRFEKSSR